MLTDEATRLRKNPIHLPGTIGSTHIYLCSTITSFHANGTAVVDVDRVCAYLLLGVVFWGEVQDGSGLHYVRSRTKK